MIPCGSSGGAADERGRCGGGGGGSLGGGDRTEFTINPAESCYSGTCLSLIGMVNVITSVDKGVVKANVHELGAGIWLQAGDHYIRGCL